jgi:hypothetical protein
MPVTNQADEALALIPMEPLIHTIGISWLQESMLGYPMGRMPLGNLEQSRATLSHMRQGVMMDRFFQRHTLWLAEQNLPVMACFPHLAHQKLLSWAMALFERLALPTLIVNVHKGKASQRRVL